MTSSKSAEKIAEQFKPRLVAVLHDLKTIGTKDPETLWLIGSLADQLTKAAGNITWIEFKAALNGAAYDDVLGALQKQGNALHAAGNKKAAFAAQAVATSVIASRIGTRDIVLGNKLLDDLIGRSLKGYRAAPEKLN